ncbi:MAG TPA: serine/threonine-protein kinase, partial [Anaerolineales bacterium]|nr:serine/threonine-protein kinase [Anaerolineales bacterium]
MAETYREQFGNYGLIEEIGRGGFAVVYRAENIALKRPVAIKLLFPSLFDRKESVDQFELEAQTLAALRHERIVRVLDMVRDAARLFMVLEYMAGGDLTQWQKAHGRLTFRQIAGVVADVAEALDYAHAQRQIHGDIKPGNILLTEEGRAKLSDFGLLR